MLTDRERGGVVWPCLVVMKSYSLWAGRDDETNGCAREWLSYRAGTTVGGVNGRRAAECSTGQIEMDSTFPRSLLKSGSIYGHSSRGWSTKQTKSQSQIHRGPLLGSASLRDHWRSEYSRLRIWLYTVMSAGRWTPDTKPSLVLYATRRLGAKWRALGSRPVSGDLTRTMIDGISQQSDHCTRP